MAIKFFLIYIGTFLVCSIALFAVVKNYAQAFAGSGKKTIVVGSLSSLLASLGGYTATMISKNMFTVFWVLVGIFLLLGIFHVYFFHRKYFTANYDNAKKVFIGELLFSLSLLFFTIIIFSSLQYFLKDKSFLFYPMLFSMLAFFIPMFVSKTFEAAYHIPKPEYNTWNYPLNAPIEMPDEKPGEKLLVIAFETSKNLNEKTKTNFRAKGPDNMKLGDLFYHFINDYNEVQSQTPIQYAKNEYEPYEWWFRKKTKWYQSNEILDPNISLIDNQILENTIIICERF